MNQVFAIARNTFKEAVRNRILYVLLFFAVLIMFGAWIASTLSIDSEVKIIRDLGVGAINFISVLIAVFVGIGLVYNDLDKKTIYTIVSKPISRWQFLLGKYLGLLLTIAVNVLVMTWIFASVMHLRAAFTGWEGMAGWVYVEEVPNSGQFYYAGGFAHLTYIIWSVLKALVLGLWHLLSFGFDGIEMTQGLLKASVLTILEMAVITSFAVLFSSFSTPTLSAFMTVVVFIIGRLNQDLYLFAETMVKKVGGVEALAGGQKLVYWFTMGAAHVSPNLEVFNQRSAIARFEPVTFGFYEVFYGLAYSALIFALSVLIFNRRNFK